MTVDILVLGATGLTGKLVVKYLASHPQRSTFSFGVAGRSEQKLKSLLAELSLDAPYYVVDASQEQQVQRALQQTKIVINIMSPYLLLGENIVRACIKYHVDYVDLAGELLFIGRMLKKYEEEAKQAGVTLVNLCGFDSVPSDSTIHLANKTLKAEAKAAGRPGGIHTSVSCYEGTGGFSPGTMESIYAMFDHAPLTEIAPGMLDTAITPVPGKMWPLPQLAYSLTDPETGKMTVGGLFPLQPLNRALVRRSWGLLEQRAKTGKDSKVSTYGSGFKYDEFVKLPSRLYGMLFTLSIAVFMIAVTIPPLRKLLKRIFAGGVGGDTTDMAILEARSFSVTNITKSVTSPRHPKPITVKTTVRGKGDGAYLLTSVMVSESALSLIPANKESRLTTMGKEGGFLTPMTAFGDSLIESLKRSGRFEYESRVIHGAVDNGRDYMTWLSAVIAFASIAYYWGFL